MSYTKSNAAALLESGSRILHRGQSSPQDSLLPREATTESTPTTDVLVSVMNTGFKRAEESVNDVYAELVKVSVHIGRPSDPSLLHGSTYSDLEARQLYVLEVYSKCKDSADAIQVHDGKFKLVDENFCKCSLALNQAVSASTQACTTVTDTKNTLTALNATGSLGAISNHQHTIAQLEKKVAD